MSKTLEVDVTSSRKKGGGWNEVVDPKTGKTVRQRVVVGKVQYVQYDSLDEALKNLGDGLCLKHINAQVATNAKNDARAQAVGGATRDDLVAQAMQRLITSPEGMAKLQEAGADQDKLRLLISAEVEKLKAELETED